MLPWLRSFFFFYTSYSLDILTVLYKYQASYRSLIFDVYLYWVIYNFYHVLTGDCEFKKRTRGSLFQKAVMVFRASTCEGSKSYFSQENISPQMSCSYSFCDDPGVITRLLRLSVVWLSHSCPCGRWHCWVLHLSIPKKLKRGSCHCLSKASTIVSLKYD